MALWPNNRTDILGFQPVGIAGQLAFQEVQQRIQRNLAYFANEAVEETSSVPEGTFQSPACLIAPLVSGGMASANRVSDASLEASGTVLRGGPVSGSANVTLDADGASLSLVVGLTGATDLTLTAGGLVLALTIGLTGSATGTLTGDGVSLSLIIPASGSASASLSGAADLKGLLALSGSTEDSGVLTPTSVATAVWSAVAGSNNAPGTMGEKLNDAGSASNPWTEVIESGYTAAQILRLLAAVAAAKATGGGSDTVTFRDLADTKDRVAMDVNAAGDRSAVTLDLT